MIIISLPELIKSTNFNLKKGILIYNHKFRALKINPVKYHCMNIVCVPPSTIDLIIGENAMTKDLLSKHGNASNRKPKGVKRAQLSERKPIGRNKRPRNARPKCPSINILNRMNCLW